MRKRRRTEPTTVAVERLPAGAPVIDATRIRYLASEIQKAIGVEIRFDRRPAAVRMIHATRQDFIGDDPGTVEMPPERFDVARHDCVVRANVGQDAFLDTATIAVVLDGAPGVGASCQSRGLVGALGILGIGCA